MSWGFRPGRSAWGMLSHLLVTIEQTDRWVLAMEDVRQAFDNVPVSATIDANYALLSDMANLPIADHDMSQLIGLADVTLRGADVQRTIGIDQGGPYSPTALNVLRRWGGRAPPAPLFRVLPEAELPRSGARLFFSRG